MTEEEVRKQEKRIAKFNALSKELIPFKEMEMGISQESLIQGTCVTVGITSGGDMYITCSKNDSVIAHVTVDYNLDIANKMVEIVRPLIFNKVKELEEKMEKL